MLKTHILSMNIKYGTLVGGLGKNKYIPEIILEIICHMLQPVKLDKCRKIKEHKSIQINQ